MTLYVPSPDSLAPLPESAQIRGVRGIYRITQFHAQRGIGRIYRAEEIPDGHPVTVREYQVPGTFFNRTEAQKHKQLFKDVAGIQLADGRDQDIRLIVPREAIADPTYNRCYLISEGNIETFPTLADYQATHGTLGETALRECLNQILQTLECLHRQSYLLPNGHLQKGLVHGNVSLDSCILYSRFGESTSAEPGESATRFTASVEAGAFTVYLCDLALWEAPFAPSRSPLASLSPRDDLRALGELAFSLLTGDRPKSSTGEALNPRHSDDWPPLCPAFKTYLQRLMALYSPYDTAEAARRDLLRLPPVTTTSIPVPPPPKSDQKAGAHIPWQGMMVIVVLAVVAQLLAWAIESVRERSPAPLPQLLCCISAVPGIPPGNITYTSERGGTWSNSYRSTLNEQGQTLDALLEDRLLAMSGKDDEPENTVLTDRPQDLPPNLWSDSPPLTITHEPRPSLGEALQAVHQGQADFLIAGVTQPLAIDLAAIPVAYDGLVAVVAFSRGDQSLLRGLNGQISLRQLQQLYTGEVTNWQQLGAADLPVRLYLPDQPDTLRIVEDRILGDRPSIEQFHRLMSDRQILQLSSLNLLQRVLKDFEDSRIGAIALMPMSQVFGQCSVYPLALRQQGDRGVAPLMDRHHRAIRPSLDLCNAKGSYFPNGPAFRDQTYPLTYPISVVYSRDNRLPPIGPKFADMLTTEEGQYLLQQAGFVPLQPLSQSP